MIFCLICSLFIILIIGFYVIYKEGKRLETQVSFRDGKALTGLPIIPLECDGKMLNFLLDTGSDASYIDSEVIKSIPCKQSNYCSETYGIDGTIHQTYYYEVTLGYNKLKFTELFGVLELTGTNKLGEDSKYAIHGILGSNFFEKYKYVIDFSNLTAYRK